MKNEKIIDLKEFKDEKDMLLFSCFNNKDEQKRFFSELREKMRKECGVNE